MPELPVVSIQAVAALKPGVAAGSSATPSPGGKADASTASSPFQDALAYELGLGCDGSQLALHPIGPASPGAAPGGDTDADPASAEDDVPAAAAAAAADANTALTLASGLILPGMPLRAPQDAPETIAALGIGSRGAPAKMKAEPPGHGGPASVVQPAGAGRVDLGADPHAPPAELTATGKNLSALLDAWQLAAASPSAAQDGTRSEPAAPGQASPTASPSSMPLAAPPPATFATQALHERVGEQGWDKSLGEKLVWMADNKQQTAELHLNPPELGPLKITLTLSHDQASAQFVSAHAQVREALENAMPRLREQLADSGITLGQASVSADAFRQPAEQAAPQGQLAGAAARTDSAAPLLQGERVLRSALGLIDTFV